MIGCVYSKNIRVSTSEIEQGGGLVGAFLNQANKTYGNILLWPPNTPRTTERIGFLSLEVKVEFVKYS